MMKPETACIAVGQARTMLILMLLWRHACLTAAALFWLVFRRTYKSTSERKAWERKLRGLSIWNNKKKRIRGKGFILQSTTKKEAGSQKDSSKSDDSDDDVATVHLYRLTKKGAAYFVEHDANGGKDFFGKTPRGYRASDFVTPAEWRHNMPAVFSAANRTQSGRTRYVTESEIRRRLGGQIGIKVPDIVFYDDDDLDNCDLWEFEYGDKYGSRLKFQSEFIAAAMTGGVEICPGLRATHAQIVRIVNPKLPSIESLLDSLSEVTKAPFTICIRTVTINAVGAIIDEIAKAYQIAPLNKEPEVIFHDANEDFITDLREIEAQNARGMVNNFRKWKEIGRFTCGKLSGQISSTYPNGRDHVVGAISLGVDTKTVWEREEIGECKTLGDFRAAILTAAKMGSALGEKNIDHTLERLRFIELAIDTFPDLLKIVKERGL